MEFAIAHFILMETLLCVSLKKKWTDPNKVQSKSLFQCKPCLFAEVSNRSHAGKALTKIETNKMITWTLRF